MSSASIAKIYTSCLSLYIFFWILGSRWPGALLALVYAINVAWKQSCEMSNVKFEFKILPQKRVIRHWYVFATKSVNPGQSKSLWDCFATFVVQLDIFIEFGLHVNVPGLESPHWNVEFRIWAKCTGVWGKITPTKLAVFIKFYPTFLNSVNNILVQVEVEICVFFFFFFYAEICLFWTAICGFLFHVQELCWTLLVQVEICGESESVLLRCAHSCPVIVLTKTWWELSPDFWNKTNYQTMMHPPYILKVKKFVDYAFQPQKKF